MTVSKIFAMKIPWLSRRAFKIPWPALCLFLLLRPCLSGEPPSLIHTDFSEELHSQLSPKCPQIVPHVYSNKVPRGQLGNNRTMLYASVKKKLGSMADCYSQCCDDEKCNMAFMYVNNSKISCYKVS